MKTKVLVLSILMAFGATTILNSQIGGFIKGKVDRAVDASAKAADKRLNKEIDKKAEEEVNKAADKIQSDAEKQNAENKDAGQPAATAQPESGQSTTKSGKQESGGGLNLGALMGGGAITSKYRESYSYNNKIFMQAEVYDGKDVVKMDYNIYFSDTSPDAGIETKMSGASDDGEQVAMSSSFVIDGANKSFLMLTDMNGTRFGIISDVPDESATTAENTPKPVISKTGNSKVIAGYKCDEYLVKETGKKEYSKLWITKDLKLKVDQRAFSKAGMNSYYNDPQLKEGFSLAMESYDDKGKLAMKAETKEINLGFKHSISTAGYPLRQMNFSQMGTQKK